MQNERSKIWTPANVVTLVRICALPFWYLSAQLASSVPVEHFSMPHFWCALFFIILSATDKLDGYLARSRNEITVFGMFLDPIADKLLVLCGLVYLLETSWISAWIVLVILAREFIVSGLRMIASDRGVVIPAGNLGKWKTAVTLGSISLYLCANCFAVSYTLGWLDVYRAFGSLASVLMYIAVVLTVVSAVEYIYNSRNILQD